MIAALPQFSSLFVKLRLHEKKQQAWRLQALSLNALKIRYGPEEIILLQKTHSQVQSIQDIQRDALYILGIEKVLP